MHFGKKDSLAGDIIYNILEDEHGNLWIATDEGLSKFNPNTKAVKNFNKSDGLPGNDIRIYPSKTQGQIFVWSMDNIKL